MMKSKLFYTNQYKTIAKRTKDFLNKHEDFLSPGTAHSTRAAGDAIEKILCNNFKKILGCFCAEYQGKFERRAMADLAFKDKQNFNYFVDVTTHREDTKFNMPNVTSPRKLAHFYEDDLNYFVMLHVKYKLQSIHASVSKVIFVPIEFLDWDCLTVGALGWGRIQIANSNYISIRPRYSRKKWMLEMCDIMQEFYPKEIGKIRKTRIPYFKRLKDRWERSRLNFGL
jgi:hypothetical protein